MADTDLARTLQTLRRLRTETQREYLALCAAIRHAAGHTPGALPELLNSLQARYDERTALDWQLASYDPQGGLFEDAL